MKSSPLVWVARLVQRADKVLEGMRRDVEEQCVYNGSNKGEAARM